MDCYSPVLINRKILKTYYVFLYKILINIEFKLFYTII